MYDFNLSTAQVDKDEDELLVDLKIDGKKGPIPKIVYEKDKKTKVWADDDDKITSWETTAEKLNAINAVTEVITGSISNPDKLRKELGVKKLA